MYIKRTTSMWHLQFCYEIDMYTYYYLSHSCSYAREGDTNGKITQWDDLFRFDSVSLKLHNSAGGLWQCFSKYMVQDGNLIRLSAFEQLTYLPSLSVNQVFVTIICFASALSGWYDQIVFPHYYGFCFQGEELVSQHITITRQRELLTHFLIPTVDTSNFLVICPSKNVPRN